MSFDILVRQRAGLKLPDTSPLPIGFLRTRRVGVSVMRYVLGFLSAGQMFSHLPFQPVLLLHICRYATEHRCGVVVSGPGLCGNISGSDPLKDHRLLLKVKPLDDTKEAAHTANVVNELSDVIRGILRNHPLNAERLKQGKAIANLVLLRGCGIRIDVHY